MDISDKVLSIYKNKIDKFRHDWQEIILASVESNLTSCVEEVVNDMDVRWAYQLQDMTEKQEFVQRLSLFLSRKVFDEIRPLKLYNDRYKIASNFVSLTVLDVIERENVVEEFIYELNEEESARMLAAGIYCGAEK